MVALASYRKSPIHLVFRLAPSGALVAGNNDREVNERTILEYWDSGLSDLISLDGSDGAIYPGRLAIVPQRCWLNWQLSHGGAGLRHEPARQRATVRLDSGKGALCKTLIRL